MTNTESKISIWYHAIQGMLTAEEKEKLVMAVELLLAERDEVFERAILSAKTAHVKSSTPFAVLQDRIAILHEWQAKDALIIQQLSESNQKLSEENYALREKVRRLEHDYFGSILAASERDGQKITQLEKEKHELTQEIKQSHAAIDDSSDCYCGICHPLTSPTDRKD